MRPTRGAWCSALSSVAIAAVVALGTIAPADAQHCTGRHWVGTWATSPSDSVGGAFVDQTLRLVVNPTLTGRRVRIRLSNRFGSGPVTFGAVTVARRAAGAALVPRSARTLRFGRQRTVTIPAGGEVVSDPRVMKVEAFQDLVVSVHVSGSSAEVTKHFVAMQTSYVSPAGSGDHTSDQAGTAFTQTTASWPFLTDVEVRVSRRIGAVVALGDSITDGFPGPVNGNGRYPDLLARRLVSAGTPELAVQNAGISGNRVLRNGGDGVPTQFGPKLLDRLDLDVIDQAGVRAVILMEGANDLGFEPRATASEVIAGLQSAIEQLQAAGLRVLVGTQTPCRDYALGAHGSPEAIADRNEINDWIRMSGIPDGVVDFHAALRDPGDPDQLKPEFDSGDHLHPSAAGYAAMADAVDLALLSGLGCP